MVKETTIIGLLGVIIGIGVFIKSRDLVSSLIFVALGLVFMYWGRNENMIEGRKDG